jgi:hypothetical protein
VCTTATTVFVALTVLQWRRLPARRGHTASTARREGVLAQWRTVAANRPFLLFADAMIGSYVLTFQVSLAPPLATAYALGVNATAVTSGLFVVSAAVTAPARTGRLTPRRQPEPAPV